MTKSKGGRPATYSSAQVLAAIDRIEQSGASPEASSVKDVLCKEHGISPGINLQSLGEEVARQLENRERVRTEALINALPETVRREGAKIGSDIQQRILEVVAHLAKSIREVAGHAIQEKDDDLDAQRQKNRALREEIAGKSEEVERLSAELTEARTHVFELEQKVRDLEVEKDSVAREEARLLDLTTRLEQLLLGASDQTSARMEAGE
ncbi:MAG: hypothetical protein NXH83_08955 [Rhodobacteraceae bacterium]|nr:hypothetical protein [Paracoccaceae bacterium]